MITPISFQTEESQGLKLSLSTAAIPLGTLNADSDSKSSSTSSKRGRPKNKVINGETVMMAKDDDSLSNLQSNVPYNNTYAETNGMLKTSIAQIDVMNNELKSDLNQIRLSKTLKRKFDYISELTGTMSTLINTKVSAIREMNNTTTTCHNLELKKMKELKLSESEQDDNKNIMDMYNAFISAPVSGGYSALGPSNIDMTLAATSNNMIRNDIGNGDAGYQNFLNNMSPVQNMMRFEQNPDIKQVVVYDQSTGRRWFDVMNVRTGETVTNVPKKDPMFLEDTTLDLKNGIARNVNLDETYPLIVIGNNAAIDEY